MNGPGMLKLLAVANCMSRRATGILLLLSHSGASTSECDTQTSGIPEGNPVTHPSMHLPTHPLACLPACPASSSSRARRDRSVSGSCPCASSDRVGVLADRTTRRRRAVAGLQVQVDAQVAHAPTGCEIHVGRLTAMTDDHHLSRARDRSGIEVLKFNYRVQHEIDPEPSSIEDRTAASKRNQRGLIGPRHDGVVPDRHAAGNRAFVQDHVRARGRVARRQPRRVPSWWV